MKMSLPVQAAKINTFPVGLYFLVAPTKGGKTLMSLALSIELDFDFLYVNEPRSAVSPDFSDFYNADGLLDRTTLIRGLETISSKGLVIDSIGDLFKHETKEPGLGKGLSFEQQLFFKRVQRKCFANKIVLIGTVNSALVPAISAFEGTTEGFVTPNLLRGSLSIIDRDDRVLQDRVLSEQALNRATNALGYGDFKKLEKEEKNKSIGTFNVGGSFRAI